MYKPLASAHVGARPETRKAMGRRAGFIGRDSDKGNALDIYTLYESRTCRAQTPQSSVTVSRVMTPARI